MLKESFVKALKQIVDNKEEIQTDIERLIRNAVKKCDDEVKIGDRLLKDKEKLNRERNKLLDLCIKEIISEEQYTVKNRELENKIIKINKQIKEQQDKQMMRNNIDEILNNVRKVVDKILSITEFNKNVCKELVDKVIIYSSKKFDFYLKGYKDPYFFGYESNILSLQR